jgi:hypothetical protein
MGAETGARNQPCATIVPATLCSTMRAMSGFELALRVYQQRTDWCRVNSLTEVFMRTITLAAAMLTGSILLPACADTNATAPLQAPSFNFMNNPDNGNVNIFRFEDAYVICWTDSKSSLRACHSTVPLGDGSELDCGPQAELDPVAFQGVVPFETIRQILQGPVWITVRDLDQPGECFDALLVAEGTGTLNGTDNDLFFDESGGQNANAWGWSASGTLTTPAGTETGYSGHARFVFNEKAGFKSLSADVNLR